MNNSIDSLGTVPTITFKPPVPPKANRKYHVGLNNRMGRLRYAYYKRRGWIRDMYYIKPQQPAWVEWAHCLVSPSHARATWLRLTPEAEERALGRLKAAVIALIAAVIFTAGVIVGEQIMLNHLRHQTTQQQIELRTAEL